MTSPIDVRAAYEAAPQLTHVALIFREGRLEHWLRFGRPAAEQRIDRFHRIASFAPGSVFAFVRWAANDYGTVVSRIDIVRAVGFGQAFQTLPCVRRGGELLLSAKGWPKVEKVLLGIDSVEAEGIDAADVSPDYWRHVNNRLSAGQEPRAYGLDQHRRWLLRRKIMP